MPRDHEIAILDFGSQYTHLIARRIRELGVRSHIYPHDVSSKKLKNAKGIILSGGPRSVVKEPVLSYDPNIFELGTPILGLCYGHQLVAKVFGGTVTSGTAREYGMARLCMSDSDLFKGLPKETTVWMSHGDHVKKIPDGFEKIGKTDGESITAMEERKRKIYGLQFHPEVSHTEHGMMMLSNFVFGICFAPKNWDTAARLHDIRNLLGSIPSSKKMFLLVSGGIDSTLCFALFETYLGKHRVYGLHIDHGLMRKNESKEIIKILKQIGWNDLHVYNAEKEFLGALEGVVDPEEKRKRIGNLFLDITERVMEELGCNKDEWILAQGTIYPDTIESGGTKQADTIKTHHNRVPRVTELIEQGRIIEPIKDLYKDEVRELASMLGLPKNLIDRHPFPGPGLAIRCLSSNGGDELVGLIQTPAFPPLYKLPIQSVGVQGDERSYAHPVAVHADDKSWNFFEHIAPEITNNIPQVNRVLRLIHGDEEKLLSSHLFKKNITKERLDLLREIDAIVNTIVEKDPEFKTIWQMPIILVPFGYKSGESIVLRPVSSIEAMTVTFAKLKDETLSQISTHSIFKDIDFIFYDVTNKPPGTIEWE